MRACSCDRPKSPRNKLNCLHRHSPTGENRAVFGTMPQSNNRSPHKKGRNCCGPRISFGEDAKSALRFRCGVRADTEQKTRYVLVLSSQFFARSDKQIAEWLCIISCRRCLSSRAMFRLAGLCHSARDFTAMFQQCAGYVSEAVEW